MKTLLLLIFVAIGYNLGWAAYSWSKWFAIPVSAFVAGATIRMIWG